MIDALIFACKTQINTTITGKTVVVESMGQNYENTIQNPTLMELFSKPSWK